MERYPALPSCFDFVAVIPKKRRRTEDEKSKYNKDTHPLRPPCGCRRKCSTKLPQTRRMEIWTDFWSNAYNARRQIIHQLVQSKPKKVSTSQTSNRQFTFNYHLISSSSERIQVCKLFFLATIGYGSKSSVVDATKSLCTDTSSIAAKDKRGKHKPKHKLPPTAEADIDAHINSFAPAISHYHCKHAPNRLYLPNELTVRDMFISFKASHPLQELSYPSYLRRVQRKKILFTKLGQEECERCMEFELKHDHGEYQGDCEVCIQRDIHLKNASQARTEYKRDGNEVKPGVVAQMCKR